MKGLVMFTLFTAAVVLAVAMLLLTGYPWSAV